MAHKLDLLLAMSVSLQNLGPAHTLGFDATLQKLRRPPCEISEAVSRCMCVTKYKGVSKLSLKYRHSSKMEKSVQRTPIGFLPSSLCWKVIPKFSTHRLPTEVCVYR